MGTVRAQDPRSISRRPTNILIAEDDRPLAAALARILEDNGYDADLVHNGEEAVDYALAGQYDVIILDVMLPRKDGFAITSELRRANLSTPILLLTARGATSDKITGYDPGGRRLHDQALLPRRADGAPSGPDPPPGGRGVREAHGG